jgi:hypothetical protein
VRPQNPRLSFGVKKRRKSMAQIPVTIALLFACFASSPIVSEAQQRATPPTALIPLPGKGLAEHPFLYCGEWQNQSLQQQTVYLVRDGKVVWTYTNPKKGELGDCTMMSNGNIVFSRQYGASEVTPDKRIVWNYDAPPNTEIHTAYPLGKKEVLIMQNGSPAKLLVIRKHDNHVGKELILPTKSPSTHGQFRHVRPKNGNTLISGNQNGYVREVNPSGQIVWEITKSDLPDYPLYTVQEVSRLSNGNTLINNWTANLSREKWPSTFQLIEITPAKQVVWALSDWSDLGPASATQLLDEKGVPEKGGLQR